MITLFWTGYGWVVFASAFLISLIAEIITELFTDDDQYYQVHGLPLAIALLISAGVNAVVFWSLYAPKPEGGSEPQSSIGGNDRLTGHRHGWFDHSFMLINNGAWVIILVGCAVGVLVSRGF